MKAALSKKLPRQATPARPKKPKAFPVGAKAKTPPVAKAVKNGKINGKSPSASLMQNGGPSKKKLADMKLEDLMNDDDESDASQEDEGATSDSDQDEASLNEETDEEVSNESEADIDEEESDEEGENSEEDDDEKAIQKHQESLAKLKDIDPEFYAFLSQNDRNLLKMESSDSEEDEKQEAKEPAKAKKGKKSAQGKDAELDSDDSDYEDPDAEGERPGHVITQKMLDEWQEQLRSDKPLPALAALVNAFRAAVKTTSAEDEKDQLVSKYKVEGSTMFNAVVRLCLTDMIPTLTSIIKPGQNQKENSVWLPEKSKAWAKVKLQIKSYLVDLIRLLSSLTSASLVLTLVKHIHTLVPYFCCFGKIAKVLCKRLVSIWSGAASLGQGQESARVLAFLCLLRLCRTIPELLLETVLKVMYLTYTRTVKFTSPTTWAAIHFMRRSLVEVLALQPNLTYSLAFLYIRQLAIHLRNAVTLKKKDSTQLVYNWQFVHCCHLWAALLGSSSDNPILKPLVYPLVQILTGTINLIPTAKYYPLRFHCVNILTQLSKQTGVFIPVLPFIVEVLQKHNFKKKVAKASMRPLDMSCILKFSQSQLTESGLRDVLIEAIYDCLMEYLTTQSHSVAFPELVLPLIVQLKTFLKEKAPANQHKKVKQLLDKVTENMNWIQQKRQAATFALADMKAVSVWEAAQAAAGPPLATYYARWRKLRDKELAIRAAQTAETKKIKGEFKAEGDDEEEEGHDAEQDDEVDRLLPEDLSDTEKPSKRKAEDKVNATAAKKKKDNTKADQKADATADEADKVQDLKWEDLDTDDEVEDDEDDDED
nr:EOG090X02MG [Triops cancriformis]